MKLQKEELDRLLVDLDKGVSYTSKQGFEISQLDTYVKQQKAREAISEGIGFEQWQQIYPVMAKIKKSDTQTRRQRIEEYLSGYDLTEGQVNVMLRQAGYKVS